MDNLLEKRRNGFFIDCGAADGIHLSNTLFLEIERNWTGLLVEANPTYFKKLLSLNRNAYSSNVCLNTRNISEIQMFEHPSNDDSLGGILKDLDYVNTTGVRNPTQCFPLDVLLNALGVSHVDYFSLDVEGAEIGILNTIPFDTLTIDVIGLEYRINQNGKYPLITDIPATIEKLKKVRHFFHNLKIYKEVGILSIDGTTQDDIDANGLDVFFQRIV